jgi:protein O-mannosyl-transferase
MVTRAAILDPQGTPPPPRFSRLSPWPAGFSLVALIFLAYLPLIHAGFIWDDDSYLLNDVALGSWRGLFFIWFHPLKAGIPQYYPLTFTTLWIEFHLFGLKPLELHVFNVLLHATSAIVLWRLLRRLEVSGSWLIAALFAVHPVHMESVAWISERKNVLSGLLYLLSLSAYLRYSPVRGRWYALSLFLFILALLSKSVTSSLPVAVLLILYWKRGSITRRDIVLLAPYFLLGAAMGIVTSWMERNVVGARGPEWNFSLAQRILIAGHALWFYAAKLYWPNPLIFTYPRWNLDTTNSTLFLYPGAAAAMVVLLWFYRKQIGRGPFVAVLFFAISLFPALGFVNVFPMRYSFVADHFQYLASIGLFTLAVGGGAYLLRRFVPNQPQIGAILAAGILVLLVSTSFARAFAFRDLQSLWRDTLAKNPGCWMAHNNLGVAYFNAKDYDRSLAEFRTAAALNPYDVESDLNAAKMELFQGTMPETIRLGRQAIEHIGPENTPDNRDFRARGWFIIGCALFREGDAAGCEDAFWTVVDNDPKNVTAHRGLAEMLEEQGDWSRALKEWEVVATLDPKNVEAHQMLAPLYAADGHYDLSTKELRLAMSQNHNLLGQINNYGKPTTRDSDQ